LNRMTNLPAECGRLFCSALIASALAAATLPANPAFAQDAKAPDTTEYTLKKRVFKTGDVNRYKLAMKNHIGEQEILLNILFKETTKDSKPTGEFTLVNQFESAVVNVGGNEQDISSLLPVVTVLRDKAGKLTTKTEGGNEQASAQISSMMQSLSTMQEAYLPKNPIKVGDKWKVSVSTPGPAGGTTKTDGEATLVGSEIVGGVKSLKLKVISDVDNAASSVKAHSESTMNIDPDSGKLLKMLAKIDGTAAGMKMTQELEMTSLPPDKK
jgi:hypothetical protein